MRHTKRLFALFAALALVLALLPTAAMAAAGDTGIHIGTTELTANTKYYTAENGGSGNYTVSAHNYTTTTALPESYARLTYDTTNGYTLIFHNFTFEGNSKDIWDGVTNYLIYARYTGTGLTIALEGENSVTCTGSSSNSYGIYINGAITFTGTGSLTATGGNTSTSCGIYSNSGGITMAGTGTVTGIGGTASSSSCGVYADGGAIIVSSGTLRGEGGSGSNSYGVYASNSISVTGGALTGQGGQASAYSCGVRAGGTIQVSDSGTLTGTGGQVTGSSGSSYGVYASGSSITVTGGTLTGRGGTDSSASFGALAGSVTVSGSGSLTATGEDYGVDVYTTFTLNGGHTIAKGGTWAVGDTVEFDISQFTISSDFDYAWRTSEETETYTLGSETGYVYDAAHTYLEVLPASEVVHPVTGVTLNTDALTLGQGDRETLTATVSPADATNQNVTWSSSDTNVATVSTNGQVTAVAPGEATITVTTEDGNFTDTCAVTVVPTLTPVEPSGQVGYLVEHYLEGRDGYELEETEIFYDEIGATVTAPPRTTPAMSTTPPGPPIPPPAP